MRPLEDLEIAMVGVDSEELQLYFTVEDHTGISYNHEGCASLHAARMEASRINGLEGHPRVGVRANFYLGDGTPLERPEGLRRLAALEAMAASRRRHPSGRLALLN